MTPDNELLRRYARTRSEDAFAELVRRHVNMVYSAALRQVNGDAHLARDVSQAVFTDLARKAGSLVRRESLAGWLYTSAHFAAAKIVRTENRRRNREVKFMRDPVSETAPETDWEKIRSVLDDAMHELAESDREAILLRYFENRRFAEVGAKLGLNENAARMRLERALEKLRAIFAKRGITTAATLASMISANAVQLAPANLAATLTTTSIAAAGTGTTFMLMKMLTVTKLKLALSAIVVAGAVTAFVHQHQTQNKLHVENELLQQRIVQLQTDIQNLSNQLATAKDAKLLSDEQMNELLRLRAEVTRLRQQQIASPIASQSKRTGTDANPIEIHTTARFVSIPAEDVQLLNIGWTTDVQGNKSGVLTEQQFKEISKALNGANDAETMSEPQVITLNGMQARMSATRAMLLNGTNVNLGETIDVTAYFSTNSSTFDLNLAAQLNQLTDDATQPDLRTILITNQFNLSPGQTAILEKEIPKGSWLPDATNVPAGPRSLLIFVTPQAVNSRGEAMKVLPSNQ